jgi:hypothetical protein
VKSDGPLMTKLDAAVSGMADEEWQNTCVAMLKRIKSLVAKDKEVLVLRLCLRSSRPQILTVC